MYGMAYCYAHCSFTGLTLSGPLLHNLLTRFDQIRAVSVVGTLSAKLFLNREGRRVLTVLNQRSPDSG